MISVVIPLYNKEKFISSTIQSVLNQTFKDLEIIVVDDGSTDNSVAQVKAFSDPRIRIISQQNSGVSAARNRGIAEAKGEFIAFLDADDEWHPDYLMTQKQLTQTFPDCQVFATKYLFQDSQGSITPLIIRNLPFNSEAGILSNYFLVASTSHPPLWTSAILIKKNALRAIGGFPIGIKSGEDLLTWAKLACRFKIAYCKKPLAVFNVEGYNIKDKPKRIPPKDDFVGNELLKLKQEFHPTYINRYISHWHKMRSSIFMRLHQRRNSIKEALIGLRYYPLNYKLYAFILLNLLPSKLQPF